MEPVLLLSTILAAGADPTAPCAWLPTIVLWVITTPGTSLLMLPVSVLASTVKGALEGTVTSMEPVLVENR